MSSVRNEIEQIGPYRVERTLGEGSYGHVKLGRHVQQASHEVAIKVIEKERIKTQQQMERLKREVRMLKLLTHPHIVQLYDVVEAERLIYLTMEVAKGGEIFDYIVARGRLKEREARRLFRQVASAIAYCHANFIVHRDIKPENLLLDANHNVKIIGMSLHFQFDSIQFNYNKIEMISGMFLLFFFFSPSSTSHFLSISFMFRFLSVQFLTA